ncbi:MAG: hypothetical protein EOM10_12150, partial [Opitutae bacterium]|nr:hypothetical protein [Opitutae bacterium]
MNWWEWARAQRALQHWVRVLIGPRPYHIHFVPGGGSFVCFATQELVVDPTLVTQWGGPALLPQRWRGQRVTDVAALAWRVSRTVARHEAGHILFTDPYPILGSLHAWLTNALEDERMERLTGRAAPPARADFVTLARMLAQHLPWPDPTTRPATAVLLHACLQHRWDRQRPAGTPSRLCFASADDAAVWTDQIAPIVERAWMAPTAQVVADEAATILRLLGLPEDASQEGRGLPSFDRLPSPTTRQPEDGPLAALSVTALRAAEATAAPAHDDHPDDNPDDHA